MRNGGELILDNVKFNGGSVQGGQRGLSDYLGGHGNPPVQAYAEGGRAAGTAMFLQGFGSITYQVSHDLTLSDTITDEAGLVATTGYTPPAGFTPGSYTLVKTGLATLTLFRRQRLFGRHDHPGRRGRYRGAVGGRHRRGELRRPDGSVADRGGGARRQ